MAFYRFFGLDRYGHVVKAYAQNCGTDDDIRATAGHFLEASNDRIIDVEAWIGAKFIMKVGRQSRVSS